jgi:hypothetical protein
MSIIVVQQRIDAWSKSLRKHKNCRHPETMAAWKLARSSARQWAATLSLAELMAKVGKLWDAGECGSLMERACTNDLIRRGKFDAFVNRRYPGLKQYAKKLAREAA